MQYEKRRTTYKKTRLLMSASFGCKEALDESVDMS